MSFLFVYVYNVFLIFDVGLRIEESELRRFELVNFLAVA
jgi:hypothetical protein